MDLDNERYSKKGRVARRVKEGGETSKKWKGLSLIFQGIGLRAAPFPAFDEFQSWRCSRASSFNRKRPITGHLIVRENNRITSSAANRIKIEWRFD